MGEQAPLEVQTGDDRLTVPGSRDVLERLRSELDETVTSLGARLGALQESVTDHDEIGWRHGEDLIALRVVGDRHAAEISDTRSARHEVHESLTELEHAVRERRLATERLSDRLAKSQRALTDYRWQTRPVEVSQARAHELLHRLWVNKIWRVYRRVKTLLRSLLPTLHDSLAAGASKQAPAPTPPANPAPDPSRQPLSARRGVRTRIIEWWELRIAARRARRRARRLDEADDNGKGASFAPVQHPIDRDRLCDLLERDKVIVNLKKVLVERERRIELLERQLAVVSGEDQHAGPALVAERAEDVDASVTHTGPQASDELVAVHGVYDDGWLSTDALFRVGPLLRGKTLRVGLWLPHSYRGVPKKGVRFEIDGGISTHVEVTRDREFQVELPIPPGDGDLGIRIITDTLESPRLRDIRQLGVRLTRWEGVEPSVG